jgi:hypothetical protein
VSSHTVLLRLLALTVALILANPSGALPTEPYSYDFPEDVAPALGTSLSHLLGATNPTQQRKGKCLRWGNQGLGLGKAGEGASFLEARKPTVSSVTEGEAGRVDSIG